MVARASRRANTPTPDATLPRAGWGLPPGRRWSGLALALVGPPVATAVLSTMRDDVALGSVLLLYLLLVVVAAAVGGVTPGALAAGSSFLLANWFLVPPYHTLFVENRDSVIELVVFAGVAGVVALTVHLAAREQANAERSQFESRMLARFTAEPVSDLTLDGVLEEVRVTFGMSSAALVPQEDPDGAPLAVVGTVPPGKPSIQVPASPGLLLIAHGPTLFAEDRRVLTRLAATAARAWEGQQLAEQAARARDLAAADRARSALLAAVGHDLRTPLAGIKAAVSSLRQDDVAWSDEEKAELLESIEHGADRLDALIANLLDMSRLQADALSVRTAPVAIDEVVARAMLHEREADVVIEIPDDLPLVLSDAGLLERVVANVVDNARRYAPAGSPVLIAATQRPDHLDLTIADRGPGVPSENWPRMFVPFQRLDDRSAGPQVGLGLAIAQGFTEAMGGTLTPSDTPGGGLTMTIGLPWAA